METKYHQGNQRTMWQSFNKMCDKTSLSIDKSIDTAFSSFNLRILNITNIIARAFSG